MNDSDAVAATCFDGWVDEFRFTIAAARYTANFTPPTDAFPRNTGDSNWGSVKCATRWRGAYLCPTLRRALEQT
jgi:hypothetical protein